MRNRNLIFWSVMFAMFPLPSVALAALTYVLMCALSVIRVVLFILYSYMV